MAVSRPNVLVVGSFRSDGTPCGITTAMRNFANAPIVEKRLRLVVANTYRVPAKRGLLERASFGARLTVGMVFRIVRGRISIVDVHTASGPDFLKHVAVVAAARATGTPVLLRVHGGDFENNFRKASRAGKWATRWALRQASQVVALSEGWAGKFVSTEPKAKVTAIPNSVDCSHFGRLGDRRPSRSRRILMLANLCEAKGHFTLIEALPEVIEKHPDCLVELAGAEREDRARDALEKRVMELGLQENVVFRGTVSGKCKDDLFKSAEFFILPSHTENMPVSIVEAMASGLPVIATRVGALPEMVEEGRTGVLISPRSVSELAHAMLKFLDEPAWAEELGVEGRRHAVETWDQNTVASKSLKLMDELL